MAGLESGVDELCGGCEVRVEVGSVRVVAETVSVQVMSGSRGGLAHGERETEANNVS